MTYKIRQLIFFDEFPVYIIEPEELKMKAKKAKKATKKAKKITNYVFISGCMFNEDD